MGKEVKLLFVEAIVIYQNSKEMSEKLFEDINRVYKVIS